MAGVTADALSDGTVTKLKFVIVGDVGVGKTSIIHAYCNEDFLLHTNPKELHLFTYSVVLYDVNLYDVSVDIYDMGGEYGYCGDGDYDRVRYDGYQGTSCFIVVFAVDNPTSYENVRLKWYPEIRRFAPNSRVIIVANKIDLRAETSTSEAVTYENGKKLAKNLKADNYVECSAKTKEDVKKVFDEATHLSFQRIGKKKTSGKNRSCTLL